MHVCWAPILARFCLCVYIISYSVNMREVHSNENTAMQKYSKMLHIYLRYESSVFSMDVWIDKRERWLKMHLGWNGDGN